MDEIKVHSSAYYIFKLMVPYMSHYRITGQFMSFCKSENSGHKISTEMIFNVEVHHVGVKNEKCRYKMLY